VVVGKRLAGSGGVGGRLAGGGEVVQLVGGLVGLMHDVLGNRTRGHRVVGGSGIGLGRLEERGAILGRGSTSGISHGGRE
jgi:hypothetical protein